MEFEELYEKLRDVYIRAWGTRGKQLLESKIEKYIKHGLSREEAILKVATDEGYVEKAIRRNLEARAAIRRKKREETEGAVEQEIHDYEKGIEKLTLLFSKGEIGEESYKTAVKSLEKKMSEIKEKMVADRGLKKEVGNEWWLLPILLGIAGGITAWAINRTDDRKKAEKMLIVGIIWGIILQILIGVLLSFRFVQMMREIREIYEDFLVLLKVVACAARA